MITIDRKVVNLPPKRKILTALLQNCKKSAIEHSIKNLRNFVSCICIQYFFQSCKSEQKGISSLL